MSCVEKNRKLNANDEHADKTLLSK